MERLITAVGAVRPSSGPSGPSGVMGRALALTIVAGRTVTPLSHFVFFRDGRALTRKSMLSTIRRRRPAADEDPHSLIYEWCTRSSCRARVSRRRLPSRRTVRTPSSPRRPERMPERRAVDSVGLNGSQIWQVCATSSRSRWTATAPSRCALLSKRGRCLPQSTCNALARLASTRLPSRACCGPPWLLRAAIKAAHLIRRRSAMRRATA